MFVRALTLTGVLLLIVAATSVAAWQFDSDPPSADSVVEVAPAIPDPPGNSQPNAFQESPKALAPAPSETEPAASDKPNVGAVPREPYEDRVPVGRNPEVVVPQRHESHNAERAATSAPPAPAADPNAATPAEAQGCSVATTGTSTTVRCSRSQTIRTVSSSGSVSVSVSSSSTSSISSTSSSR